MAPGLLFSYRSEVPFQGYALSLRLSFFKGLLHTVTSFMNPYFYRLGNSNFIHLVFCSDSNPYMSNLAAIRFLLISWANDGTEWAKVWGDSSESVRSSDWVSLDWLKVQSQVDWIVHFECKREMASASSNTDMVTSIKTQNIILFPLLCLE